MQKCDKKRRKEKTRGKKKNIEKTQRKVENIQEVYSPHDYWVIVNKRNVNN